MSDVTILYNPAVVSPDDLTPLVERLRPVIAEIVDMSPPAILFQFSAPEVSDGYADIDITVLTTADEDRNGSVNQPIADAVKNVLQSFVKESGLPVRSIGGVARIAEGRGFFEPVE